MEHLTKTGEHLMGAGKELSLLALESLEKGIKTLINVIDNKKTKEERIEEKYDEIVPKEYDRTYWTTDGKGNIVEVDDEN